MQAVLGDMGLEMDGATDGAALWADVRRLVLMDSLMRGEAALVWQQHLADGAGFLQQEENKKDVL